MYHLPAPNSSQYESPAADLDIYQRSAAQNGNLGLQYYSFTGQGRNGIPVFHNASSYQQQVTWREYGARNYGYYQNVPSWTSWCPSTYTYYSNESASQPYGNQFQPALNSVQYQGNGTCYSTGNNYQSSYAYSSGYPVPLINSYHLGHQLSRPSNTVLTYQNLNDHIQPRLQERKPSQISPTVPISNKKKPYMDPTSVDNYKPQAFDMIVNSLEREIEILSKKPLLPDKVKSIDTVSAAKPHFVGTEKEISVTPILQEEKQNLTQILAHRCDISEQRDSQGISQGHEENSQEQINSSIMTLDDGLCCSQSPEISCKEEIEGLQRDADLGCGDINAAAKKTVNNITSLGLPEDLLSANYDCSIVSAMISTMNYFYNINASDVPSDTDDSLKQYFTHQRKRRRDDYEERLRSNTSNLSKNSRNDMQTTLINTIKTETQRHPHGITEKHGPPKIQNIYRKTLKRKGAFSETGFLAKRAKFGDHAALRAFKKLCWRQM
nr:PREDICTED: uncharacterized protein LOC107076965 isoform X2 [Lepisosteus oculatus]XP_015199186.1 PREDICTED: uncharacterized protein LOC107076965 isoform X2 [Lepisosteus oculatus]